MNQKVFIAAGLLLVLASLGSPAQERQVPFDNEGKILALTRATADQLGLYQDYPKLTEAMLFQTGEDSYVLEIRQKEAGRVVLNRIAMSAADVLDLRARISALVAERKPASVLDQSGRFALLLGDFILSYGFYGMAVPASLGITDFYASTGVYLLTSGAGFFIPLFLTAKAEVTPAQATLSLGLATLGIYHGLALYFLVSGDILTDSQAVTGIAVLTSLAEGVAGYFLARPLALSASEAGLVDFMGVVGTVEGALLSLLTDSVSRESFIREIFGVSLAGSAGGLALGKLMTDWTNVSPGDLLLVADTTYLGVMGATCLTLMRDQYFTPQLMSGIFMAGLTAGVGSGYLMQVRKDYNIGRMNIISLCMLGGALVGSGLGYLVAPNAVYETPWLIPTMGFVGSGLAFGISLAVFDAARGPVDDKQTKLSLSVNPASLLGLRPGARDQAPSLPAVQLRLQY